MNKIYNLIKVFCVFVLSLVFLSGCSSQNNLESSVSNDKLTVYTSIFPVYDIVSKIGGDKIEVYSLIKNGEDAHSFEPTAKDIMNLENSDILFYNGAGLESWVEKTENSISNQNLKFINLSENIHLIEGDEDSSHSHDSDSDSHSHSHSHEYDPHIWLSPLNAVVIADNIFENLVLLDAENTEYYTANYEKFVQDLETLHSLYTEELSSLNKKEILVTHKAYGYLCDTYGLTQVSVNDNIENSEPSPAKLIEIIEYIKENDIKYILTDGLSSTKVAESISNETGVEILTLSTLESLSEEELLNNDDYLSIMYRNLEVLKLVLS